MLKRTLAVGITGVAAGGMVASWWLHHHSPLVALDREVALHLEVGEPTTYRPLPTITSRCIY